MKLEICYSIFWDFTKGQLAKKVNDGMAINSCVIDSCGCDKAKIRSVTFIAF